MDRKFRRVFKTADLFARVISRTHVDTETEAGRVGLTPSQSLCLHYILLHDSPSINELAQGLSISHPAAVRLVERLEEKGMVTKNHPDCDRRISEVSLTADGKRTIAELRAARFDSFAEVMKRMDKEDRNALQKGLKAFLRAALIGDEDLRKLCLKCGKEHEATCTLNIIHIEKAGVPLTGV